MRVFVILLLLCACVSAGLFNVNKSSAGEKLKGLLGGKIAENVKSVLNRMEKVCIFIWRPMQ